MAELKDTLAIDAGNTRIKVAVFRGNTLRELYTLGLEEITRLGRIADEHPVSHAVIGSVSADASQLREQLSAIPCMVLDHTTPLPFRNAYTSPQTLGADRIAGVAGARARYPGAHVLVIDCGTCVTYDFMTAAGDYLGGAIAPGLMMRLRAMHEFTRKLPLPDFHIPADFIGNNTENSLLSGAFYGMANEINATIGRYQQQFGELQAVICGGDAGKFEKHLKNDIFAAPDLVLEGLNQILLFNVQ